MNVIYSFFCFLTCSLIENRGEVYKELVRLFDSHACKTHVEVLHLLEKECGYAADNIPQLQDISLFLKSEFIATLDFVVYNLILREDWLYFASGGWFVDCSGLFSESGLSGVSNDTISET